LAVPTSRVRKKLPPKSPEKPTLTKAVTSLADVPATRRSQARARASPAPAAGPLIIAIVGFGCKELIDRIMEEAEKFRIVMIMTLRPRSSGAKRVSDR
jgi:hypothetical protein